MKKMERENIEADKNVEDSGLEEKAVTKKTARKKTVKKQSKESIDSMDSFDSMENAADTSEVSSQNSSIEEMFEELNGIISRMENDNLSLENSLKEYERGVRLVKACNSQMEKVEKKIIVLSGEEQFDEL